MALYGWLAFQSSLSNLSALSPVKSFSIFLAPTSTFVQSQESHSALFYLFNSLAQDFSCMIALNFINFLLAFLRSQWGEANLRFLRSFLEAFSIFFPSPQSLLRKM